MHGFAARPNLANEHARAAFEDSSAAAVEFFKKHLGL